MTIEKAIRTTIVVTLVAVLIAAPVAGAATSSAVAGSAAIEESDLTFDESDQFINVSDNVSVWRGAPLPLRADTDEGATVIGNQLISVQERSMNRQKLAVYNTTGDVPVTLSPATPGANTTRFSGQEVQVLIAHSDQNPLNSSNIEMLWERFDEELSAEDKQALKDKENLSLQTLKKYFDGELSDEDKQALNDNVDFSLEEGVEVDDNGEFTVNVDANEAGQYGVVAANGTLFDVDEDAGDLQRPDDMAGTVIGVEQFAVQSTSSTVDAPASVEPGDNVSFDVEANFADDNVSHVVALYDEKTFSNTFTNLNITGEINENLSAEDLIVEHQITEVNGVADLDRNISSDLATKRGTVGLASLFSTVTNGTPLEGVETKEHNNPVVLNASVTGVADAEADTELTVETFDNWTEGDYRYVHIAVGQNATQSFATNDGIVEVATEDNGGGGLPPAPTPEPPAKPDPVVLETDKVTKNSQHVTRDGVAPNTPVRVPLSPTTESQASGVAFQQLDFKVKSTAVADVDLTFTQSGVPPAGVKTSPTTHDGLTYMQVDHPATLADEVDNVQYTVDITRKKLEKDNRDAEDIQFYRHDGDSWSQLDAEITDETDTTVTFTVDSPGLSVYAVTYSSADIQVDGASLSETEIQAGDSVDVDVTLKNTGSTEGTYSVPLTVDGSTVDTKDVTIPAGEKASITFTQTFEDTGEYEIAADGTVAGTLTVTDDEPGTGEEEPADSGGLLMWIVGIIVIAVVGSVVFLWRTGRLESMLDGLE